LCANHTTSPNPWNITKAFTDRKFHKFWDKLEIWLPFWEKGGVPKDISGHKNTISFFDTSADPTWVNTAQGSALSFNAANSQYISINKAYQHNSSFTISMWIFPTDTEGVVASGETSGALARWSMGQGSGFISSNFYFGFWSSWTVADHGTSLATNQWHHVVGTIAFDSGAGDSTISLYVNGKLSDSATATPQNINTTVTTNLGRHGWSGERDYYDGDMRDVKIHKRTLPAAEVLQMYEAGAEMMYLKQPVAALVPVVSAFVPRMVTY